MNNLTCVTEITTFEIISFSAIGSDSEKANERKHLILSKVPRSRAYRIFKSLNDSRSLRILGRDHANSILSGVSNTNTRRNSKATLIGMICVVYHTFHTAWVQLHFHLFYHFISFKFAFYFQLFLQLNLSRTDTPRIKFVSNIDRWRSASHKFQTIKWRQFHYQKSNQINSSEVVQYFSGNQSVLFASAHFCCHFVRWFKWRCIYALGETLITRYLSFHFTFWYHFSWL